MQTAPIELTGQNGTKPSFEELCSRGREAADHLDDGRWILGELGAQVKTRYRERTLDEFAKQVGAEKARIYEYSQVWRFYDQISATEEFREANPMLRYSHYRDAMRLKEPAAVLTWLNECSDNGYTVEEARVKLQKSLGKPVPPARKSFEAHGMAGVGQGRVTLLVLSASDFGEFERDHRNDPDYKVEIVVTYTVKP